MANILDAQKAFSKLLDIEYQFVLGRKDKTVSLTIEFQKYHFFHLAGLQYLKDLSRLFIPAEGVYNQIESGQLPVSYIESSNNYDYIKGRVEYLPTLEYIFDSNDTIFKYNPELQAFSVIEADFLLRNEINKVPIFVFLSKDKNKKYFCKTFFPQGKKNYTERQTKWTVLFKKKIVKSTNTETVLYKNKNFEMK
ncbi:MAG: PBECR4 domain-containing protein [Spirochaetales bacterium]|nr:PBECR4 domain-containing protein [Spirochaetales bacterium]MDY5915787.1 PBECR4 domain-containing protein [Treponema sp.]